MTLLLNTHAVMNFKTNDLMRSSQFLVSKFTCHIVAYTNCNFFPGQHPRSTR